MSDAAFLAGIAADPADRVRRLVYADYLDDHADPRGELVRVEEAMRDLTAFGDEFWRLKLRRNELRPLAPANWLAALRYGVDAHPVFSHGVPDDPRGRWRLIREFLERWHGVPMPDCGGRAAEIAAVEARLGVTLGSGVREFVSLHRRLRRRSRARRLPARLADCRARAGSQRVVTDPSGRRR